MHRSPPSDAIKHWLLNTAVEFGVPLKHLFPEVSHALNVKPVPECGSDDYATGLIELFDLGMITLSSAVEGDDVSSRPGVMEILERFRTLSKDDPTPRNDGRLTKLHQLRRLPGMQVCFKLTALGGKAWEAIAQPDWAHYICASTVSSYGDPVSIGDLMSADQDLLLAYMGWYPEINGERIELQTVKWQTHTDFEIVYWKRLPVVYHASFELQPSEARWLSAEPKWFHDWWISTVSWYKDPWDLPDWPSK